MVTPGELRLAIGPSLMVNCRAINSDAMKNDAKPRVYDVLARAFAQEEVRTCFALLGDANMNWAARLAELGCRMIYTRHEHCALAAAMAYRSEERRVGKECRSRWSQYH